MVIYGGLVGALEWSGETWALSLDGDGTWTRIDAPGTAPTPRWLHTAVYDAARNRMIVFGGNSATRVWNNDVYTLSLGDSPVWTQITAVGGDGPLVSKHAAIYDPVRDRMVVYGGENRIFFSGLWSLSLSGDPVWTELVLDPQPPGRWGEVGIYDPRQDRFVIHGGFGILSDCWSLSLDPPGWSLIDASSGAAALEEGSPAEALASAAPHTQLSVWIEPNPFTRSARNELTLPRASVVRASVQDAQGRQVRELARRELPAGPHTLEWDGRDSAGRSLPMGAYFVCVRAGDDRIVRRTILVP
jgi:hypothetical protein